ncbi:hypothetical protein FA15DRAFT_699030 [Coprinopsis marcescibilis]|uniref:Alginate lyase domain-containing protein n=1 Tax=Coprinopsis marcescibilis TaxID=230819 RepID=A0A5C3LFB4_COPMA|nr:hypothetical protein FA15DRAFT_699030 [Coprinopsis marcescibilis]
MPPTYSKPEDSPDPSDAVEPGDGGIPYEESINFAKRSLEQIHLAHHRRIMKLKQRHDVGIRPLLIERPLGTASELVPILLPSDPLSAVSLPAPLPTQLPVASDLLGGGRTTVSRTATTHAPAQAAAKTTKTTCTPSPTTSMAPSATWTRCSYVGRDGQINPDVRKLNGPGAINAISQYVLYGSISVAANKSSKHARGVVNAIDTFFLSPSTAMNPNMNFGQIVRGPGPEGSSGTFTGILDLRGLGKVVNGLMVLKSLGIPEWTTAKDQSMRSWVSRYTQWLTQSDIGKMSATRPNNHATFYVTQLAAAKLYQGSSEEAKAILTQFFKKQFGDQIAASGEQPFEAIRSRPYHYRCFNLEALIANAKLGDFLGVNFWNTRSKYGATIQTALDYAMACDPQGEEVVDLIPHVAAVAAAYGDPNGKYASFLRKNMVNYQSKPFWFYDQPAAFSERSSSGKLARSLSEGEDGQPDSPPTAPPPKIPFSCPDVFKDATSVEIDNGVFVTCDDLRPLYEAAVPQI